MRKIEIKSVLCKLFSLIPAIAGSNCGVDHQNATGDIHIGQISQRLEPSGSPIIGSLAAGTDEQGPLRDLAEKKCTDKYDSIKEADRHSACVAMFMARYFGGKPLSYTFSGTLIDWADSDTPAGKSERPWAEIIRDPGGSYIGQREFEAIWGPNGALCLNSPRHDNLFWNNIPTGYSIRSCYVDPKDPNTPWIKNPFPGTGKQLISYRVNYPGELYSIKDPAKDALYFGFYTDVGQTILDTVHIPGRAYRTVPIRERSPKTVPAQYEAAWSDLNYIRVWESCETTVPAKCDYVTTSYDMFSDDVAKARLKIGVRQVFTQNPNLGHGYIFKDRKPNTVALNTYHIWFNGQYRHITTTENGIAALGGYFEFLQLEGYVHHNQVTLISD